MADKIPSNGDPSGVVLSRDGQHVYVSSQVRTTQITTNDETLQYEYFEKAHGGSSVWKVSLDGAVISTTMRLPLEARVVAAADGDEAFWVMSQSEGEGDTGKLMKVDTVDHVDMHQYDFEDAGMFFGALQLSNTGRTLAVVHSLDAADELVDSIDVVDTQSGARRELTRSDQSVYDIAVDDQNGVVYVARMAGDGSRGDIQRIDLATGQVIGSLVN